MGKEIFLAICGAGELLEEVLDRHEARHWDRWNRELGVGLAREDQHRAVALATLLGADTEAEAVAVVRLVPGLEDSSGERARTVARWLSRLYGGGRLDRRPAIAPLEPDLLAEALITREVTAVPELLGAALDAASDRQLTRALVVLSRAAGREGFGEVARAALDGRLPAIVRRLTADHGRDEELLTATRSAVVELRPHLGAVTALDELPEESTSLATLAAEVTQLAVDILSSAANDDPDQFLPDLAMSLNNLSIRLSDLGRAQEALTAIQEAVQSYRALADASPERFLPELAMSLNNLSNRLGDLGRPQDALTPIQEAVKSYRALADARPERFLPDLACR